MLTTGSQGEPLSALRRMAHHEHPQVKLHSGDTIIFSATPIPGNERAVNETVDRLYQIGATVITTQDAAVHASGHGWSEELKLMLNLTKPRYVMPIHGDHKRLHLHAQARRVGRDRPRGDLQGPQRPAARDRRARRAVRASRSSRGVIFVDGVEVGDIEDVALRDRRALSADGIFIVVATISGQDGRPIAAARGHLPRRAVPDRGGRRRGRDPRHGRGVARPGGARTRSARSRCSRSTCATTWSRSSTSACAAGRWCCRWSSRSEPAGSAWWKGIQSEGEQTGAPFERWMPGQAARHRCAIMRRDYPPVARWESCIAC